jgi:hypothetical protein
LDLPKPLDYTSQNEVNVEITVDKFDLARSSLVGTVHVRISPREGVAVAPYDPPRAAALYLGHTEVSKADQIFSVQGIVQQLLLKPDKVIQTSTEGEDVFGEEKITWQIGALRSSFLYPFDSYRVYVNPELWTVFQEPSVPRSELPVDRLEIDFRASPFAVSVTDQHAYDYGATHSSDPFEILLERPRILQVMVLALGCIALISLWFLAAQRNISHLWRQSLAFFVTVWGVRDILLKDVVVFPTVLDYTSLGLYLVAASIILVKWAFK